MKCWPVMATNRSGATPAVALFSSLESAADHVRTLAIAEIDSGKPYCERGGCFIGEPLDVDLMPTAAP